MVNVNAPHFEQTLQALADAATRVDLVLVPGFKNSGPEHWQSLWEAHSPAFLRITQKRWDNPDVDLWVDAIRRLLATRDRPAILIGHSLGALASICVAADHHPHVAGLMLVATARPSRFEAMDRVPHHALDVPAMMIASQNDPMMRFTRAEYWSRVWNADLIDLGEAGHINAEAGFGLWWQGLEMLLRFEEQVSRRLRDRAEAAAPDAS